MSRNGVLLLVAIALMLSCVVMSVVAVDGGDNEPDETPSPEELYPDADVIITSDERGHIVLVFKAYGDYKVTEDHPSPWFSKTILNKTITIRDLSQAQKEMNIVFDGADVTKLTLFNIDTKSAMNSAIDVHFTMVSGAIQTFSLFSLSNDLNQYLLTSYDALPTPIHSIQMDFISGNIDLFNPTSMMLSVMNMDLNLGQGTVVNRLYTTGENGKYSNVNVTVSGAHIGYMTNIASKIGTLSYDIISGQINYLCLGANTEHTSNRTLANMATSYVSGDVDVHIGSLAKIGNCIIGAGILNIPRMLCNGDILSSVPIHMVAIDAPDVIIYNDVAFLNERRTSAYHFSNYKIGLNPYATSVMDTLSTKNSSIRVYSDSGVWSSISSCTLPTGSILSLNTRFYIQTEGVFTVSKGATMYNSGDIVLYGTLNNEGRLVNNSVIQCRSSSLVVGEQEGMGYLADYVFYPSSTNTIKVMSLKDAVVIGLQEQNAIEDITATFDEGKTIVIIAANGSSRIYGNQFMVALTEQPGVEQFDKTFRLNVKGIDRNTLGNSTVEVYMAVDPNVCNAIYVEGQEAGQFDVIATAEYVDQIKFPAGDHQRFYLYSYTTDRPELPEPEDETSMSEFDYFLVAAIIAVLAVTVYALFTMKRD